MIKRADYRRGGADLLYTDYSHLSNVELYSFSAIVGKDIDSIKINRVSRSECCSEEIIDFRDFSHSGCWKRKIFVSPKKCRSTGSHPSIDHKSIVDRGEPDREGSFRRNHDRRKLDSFLFFLLSSLFSLSFSLRRISISQLTERRGFNNIHFLISWAGGLRRTFARSRLNIFVVGQLLSIVLEIVLDSRVDEREEGKLFAKRR